ncbi:conserved hypothetical protein, partial [Ricinus communis]
MFSSLADPTSRTRQGQRRPNKPSLNRLKPARPVMENWRLKVCLAVALLLSMQLLVTKRFAALALLRLPSTIAHELSHWVVALVLGCRPSGLSFVPKRQPDNSWRLGSVMFYPGTFSAGFVALAPLWVMGTASYWILWLRPVSPELGTEVLA